MDMMYRCFECGKEFKSKHNAIGHASYMNHDPYRIIEVEEDINC